MFSSRFKALVYSTRGLDFITACLIIGSHCVEKLKATFTKIQFYHITFLVMYLLIQYCDFLSPCAIIQVDKQRNLCLSFAKKLNCVQRTSQLDASK